MHILYVLRIRPALEFKKAMGALNEQPAPLTTTTTTTTRGRACAYTSIIWFTGEFIPMKHR